MATSWTGGSGAGSKPSLSRNSNEAKKSKSSGSSSSSSSSNNSSSNSSNGSSGSSNRQSLSRTSNEAKASATGVPSVDTKPTIPITKTTGGGSAREVAPGVVVTGGGKLQSVKGTVSAQEAAIRQQNPGIKDYQVQDLMNPNRASGDVKNPVLVRKDTTAASTLAALRQGAASGNLARDPQYLAKERQRRLLDAQAAARTGRANYQSTNEKIYKVEYTTEAQNGQLNRGIYNGQNTGSSLLYSPGYSVGVRSVSARPVGLPPNDVRLAPDPKDKRLIRFVPTSGELYERSVQARDKDPFKEAGAFSFGTAVGFGEVIYSDIKGVGRFIRHPVKTTLNTGKNLYVAASDPRATLTAMGDEINQNPPKAIGGFVARYAEGKVVLETGPKYAREAYVRIGSEKVPIQKVTTPEVLSGKTMFPEAKSAAESIRAFRNSIDPRTGDLRITSATNVILKNEKGIPFTGEFTVRRGGRPILVDKNGKFIRDSKGKLQEDLSLSSQYKGTSGALARETEGLYVTPADKTSIYFTRLMGQTTEYKLLPSLQEYFNAPKIIRTTAADIQRVPMSIIKAEGRSFALSNKYIMNNAKNGNIFLTARSEKGFLGMKGQTTEIEAVIPTGTQFVKNTRTFTGKLKGFDQYTVINGRAVPIIDFKQSGITAGVSKQVAISTQDFAKAIVQSQESLVRTTVSRKSLLPGYRAGFLPMVQAKPYTPPVEEAPYKMLNTSSSKVLVKERLSRQYFRDADYNNLSVRAQRFVRASNSMSKKYSDSSKGIVVSSSTGSPRKDSRLPPTRRDTPRLVRTVRGQSRQVRPGNSGRGRSFRSRSFGGSSNRSRIAGESFGSSVSREDPFKNGRKNSTEQFLKTPSKNIDERAYTPSVYAIGIDYQVKAPERGAITSGLAVRGIIKRKRRGG